MKKRILYNGISILLILIIISCKQLRFLPHLNILWNVPYYIMSILLVFGIMLMLYRDRYNYLDIAIILFSLFLSRTLTPRVKR